MRARGRGAKPASDMPKTRQNKIPRPVLVNSKTRAGQVRLFGGAWNNCPGQYKTPTTQPFVRSASDLDCLNVSGKVIGHFVETLLDRFPDLTEPGRIEPEVCQRLGL